jgi:AAA ATPase containing von Willebrand factor type A (vWA) domain
MSIENNETEKELSLEEAVKRQLDANNTDPDTGVESESDGSEKNHTAETNTTIVTNEEQGDTKVAVNPEDEIIDEKLDLTKSDILKDPSTPGQSMSNLSKFTKQYNEEVSEAKAEYDKKVEADNSAALIKKMREEKQKSNAFNDVYVEEKAESENTTAETQPIIDVTSVKIRKPDDTAKAFNSILAKRKNKQRTTSVPLANSGYIAHMLGLSSPEIRDISLSLGSRDQFAYFEYLYQTIFDKIQYTSIGNMTYDTFLKSTALSELDILLYGMFCSTYPDENQFPMQCQHANCKAAFDFTYKNNQYLDIAKDDMSEATQAMRALIAGQTVDGTEFFKNSNTNSVFRIPLYTSKMIVEVRHPTLYNQLYDVIKVMVDNNIDKVSDTTINRMPYVNKVLVPVDEDDLSKGYYEFEDLMHKVALLTNLDELDDNALEEGISDNVLSKYKIGFKMKDIICPVCNKQTVPDYNVDFRQLLFMIHQIRSVKKK